MFALPRHVMNRRPLNRTMLHCHSTHGLRFCMTGRKSGTVSELAELLSHPLRPHHLTIRGATATLWTSFLCNLFFQFSFCFPSAGSECFTTLSLECGRFLVWISAEALHVFVIFMWFSSVLPGRCRVNSSSLRLFPCISIPIYHSPVIRPSTPCSVRCSLPDSEWGIVKKPAVACLTAGVAEEYHKNWWHNSRSPRRESRSSSFEYRSIDRKVTPSLVQCLHLLSN